MNIKSTEKKEKSIVELIVEISPEEFDAAINEAFRKGKNQISVPGFRKGKAPQHIIENFVGLDAILSEAADEVVPQAYVKGLAELELIPVEQPKIEVVQLTVNEPLIFKATFTVKPQVELGQYKGLPLTKQIREVSQSEIDADIETQRLRLSRLVEAEPDTKAALKDVLSLDFEGFHNGEPFPGGKAEKYSLELGSKSLIPGFEEQLTGIKAGEEREINVVFPENYHEAALAGQPALFKVKALELKRRVWPDLDDEFAQEVSETAETLEDLRREVAGRLQKRYEEEAERQVREDALNKATANATIDLPPLMIEQRVDSMVQSLAGRLQDQGMQMEQFLEYSGRTIQELREGYQEQAEKAVRCDLMLEAVAKAENLSVSEEEMEQQLQLMAAYYQQPPEEIKKAFSENNRMEVLKDDMLINKASNFIFENAEITEVNIAATPEDQ